MASPSNADGGSSVGGGGSESRIRYEIEQGSSLLSQHDERHTGGGGSFSSRNFNDDDGDDDDDDGAINNSDNPCPTKGRRSPFLNGGGEQHDSYSAEREREMEQGLLQGRQGEDHQRLDDDPHKDGLGNGRGIGGNEYEEEAEGSWAALQQTYNDSPPIPEETQSDPDSGGGGGGKRSFCRHRSPHQDDDLDAGQQTQHRYPPGRMMGGAPDQEAEDEDETVVVTGGGGGGDGERQRQRHSSPSIEKTSRFKQQQQLQQRQQPQRPGFLSSGKNRRPFRPGFHEEACTSEDGEGEGADEDVTSSHGHGRGGGGGGSRENLVETPSRFDPRGGGEQSGASAFSESDADDASNGTWASSKAGQGSNIHTREEGEGGEDGEEEGEKEEAGAEGRAQKRQRQQRRKHSEMLVGNGFSAITRCYEAANHAIRGVEANQRNMLEAETEIREDLVTFGVRVKEATHLMQMQLAAAFTEDGLGASGT